MHTVLLTGAVSFTTTFLVLPAIMRVASEKKLFDLPDARKLHTSSIASLGGVGIFIGLFLALLLTGTTKEASSLQYFMAAAIVTFFLGLKDDILIISARKKFLGQLAAAAILIHLGGVRIESMHGFLGIGSLPAVISYLLSYITIIVVVNAYNLIDGVDGLAGSLGVLTTSLFGAYFVYAGAVEYAILAFATTGALLAFLWYNFHPAKIFMGDSGSLLLGLVNAVLVIKFITIADASGSGFPLTASVALGFSVLFIPLFDTLRVFTIRLSRGRSPFAPDRNHIHHLFLDRNLNHRQTALSCLGLNAAFIAVAYLGRNLGSTVLIIVMIGTGFAIIGGLLMIRKPVSKLVVASSYQTSPESKASALSTKVVNIKSEAVVAEH